MLLRLLSLDVMEDAIDQFDTTYDVRAREIVVVYAPFWAVR
jgi:hypothetical protein